MGHFAHPTIYDAKPSTGFVRRANQSTHGSDGTSKTFQKRCAQKRISPAISTRFGSSRLRGKNIALFIFSKSASFTRHPASSKRGVRVVTIRGVRVAVDAMALRARGIAGRSRALSWGCERLIRAGRAAQFAYGKTVWSRHPWLVSSWRRLIESNRVRSAANPAATEARGIRLRGERGISRQTIAQGRPDALRWTCMLVCALPCAHCTRDRGCSAHPVFPAPSHSRGGKRPGTTRARRAARTRWYIHSCDLIRFPPIIIPS